MQVSILIIRREIEQGQYKKNGDTGRGQANSQFRGPTQTSQTVFYESPSVFRLRDKNMMEPGIFRFPLLQHAGCGLQFLKGLTTVSAGFQMFLNGFFLTAVQFIV